MVGVVAVGPGVVVVGPGGTPGAATSGGVTPVGVELDGSVGGAFGGGGGVGFAVLPGSAPVGAGVGVVVGVDELGVVTGSVPASEPQPAIRHANNPLVMDRIDFLTAYLSSPNRHLVAELAASSSRTHSFATRKGEVPSGVLCTGSSEPSPLRCAVA